MRLRPSKGLVKPGDNATYPAPPVISEFIHTQTSWRAHGTPDPRRSPTAAAGDHRDELPLSPLDDLGGVGSRRRTRADHGQCQRPLLRPVEVSSSPLAQLPRRHALLPDSQPERDPRLSPPDATQANPPKPGPVTSVKNAGGGCFSCCRPRNLAVWQATKGRVDDSRDQSLSPGVKLTTDRSFDSLHGSAVLTSQLAILQAQMLTVLPFGRAFVPRGGGSAVMSPKAPSVGSADRSAADGVGPSDLDHVGRMCGGHVEPLSA